MTAVQAVVAVVVPALAVVLILAVPGWRKRRARHRRAVRAFAWFRPAEQTRCGCCCELEDLLDRPPAGWGPAEPEDLSGQDAVGPLLEALRRREDGRG